MIFISKDLLYCFISRGLENLCWSLAAILSNDVYSYWGANLTGVTGEYDNERDEWQCQVPYNCMEEESANLEIGGTI